MNEVQTQQDKAAENGVAILAEAKTTVVLTSEQYTEAVTRMRISMDFKKAVHDLMDPICDAANKSHKMTTSTRKELLQPYEESEKIYKGLLDVYDLEQERLAEVERKRLQKIKDDEADRIKKEQDDALAEALKLEEAGDADGAAALVDDAADLQEAFEALPEQVIEKATPKGVSYIDNWKAVIENPATVPREYCIPDQSKLDKLAKAFKGENAPAGVKFVNNRTIRRA